MPALPLSRTSAAVARFGLSAVMLPAAICVALPGIAAAQVRPAVVRSVDEPARVPYGGTMTMTCPFGNDCTVNFPVVPPGKRVRIIDLSLAMPAQSTAFHYVAVHRNGATFNTMLNLFTVAPASAAFYGSMLSTRQTLNLYFEAGETPIVELFVVAGSGGINATQARVTLTGYIVDTTP